jgi:hypothetical protein
MSLREVSTTPTTVEGTANRTRGTTEMDDKVHRAMNFDGETFAADRESSLPELRWKVGTEPPPFLAANTSVIELLIGIHDGTIDAIPAIVVSNAVAVQIYRLLFDKFAWT